MARFLIRTSTPDSTRQIAPEIDDMGIFWDDAGYRDYADFSGLVKPSAEVNSLGKIYKDCSFMIFSRSIMNILDEETGGSA